MKTVEIVVIVATAVVAVGKAVLIILNKLS